MVVSIKTEDDNQPATSVPRPLPFTKRKFGEDLMLHNWPNSHEHVVIVMDGLKEFTMKPLQWALKYIRPRSCCSITLLGVMPWLNIPLSTKTWLDIWTLELENLAVIKDKSEWKSDVKYLKLQAVVDLCGRYGVVPQLKVIMGHPLQLLVVEQISTLHATWVVFDRHQRRLKKFCARKIPCNMVMLTHNGNGEVDMIRGRSMIDNGDNTTGESPAPLVPPPPVVYSDQMKEFLERDQYTQQR